MVITASAGRKENPIPNIGIELCVRKRNQRFPEWFSCFSLYARWEDFIARGVPGNIAEHMEEWITAEHNGNCFNTVVTLTKPKSEKLPCKPD